MLKLKALDFADIETIRHWRNRPEIMRWCRQTSPISDRQQKEWFEAQHADPSIQMFKIMVEGQIVGVCGLTSINMVSRHAEFSLYTAPEYQRRGYARKALSTLFGFGFYSLNLNQIWGETLNGNHAARLFESLGMRADGTRRAFYFKDGQYIDAHLYSVLKDEYADNLRRASTPGQCRDPANPLVFTPATEAALSDEAG